MNGSDNSKVTESLGKRLLSSFGSSLTSWTGWLSTNEHHKREKEKKHEVGIIEHYQCDVTKSFARFVLRQRTIEYPELRTRREREQARIRKGKNNRIGAKPITRATDDKMKSEGREIDWLRLNIIEIDNKQNGLSSSLLLLFYCSMYTSIGR